MIYSRCKKIFKIFALDFSICARKLNMTLLLTLFLTEEINVPSGDLSIEIKVKKIEIIQFDN
jgi:hypothetical protein